MLIALVVLLVILLGAGWYFFVKISRALLERIDIVENSNQEYQHYFELLSKQLKYSTETMKSIDQRGVFEADDEVGIAFQALKKCTDLLVPFIPEEDDEYTE